MSASKKLTILLGGIGGDSHSVGLSILRQALSDRYQVFYLGTQNPLETFFEYAPLCNAVMISCMDGHAQRYLTQFSPDAHGSAEHAEFLVPGWKPYNW